MRDVSIRALLPTTTARRRTLGFSVCGILVAALLVLALLAPLPYSVLVPGVTANTLGQDHGTDVIDIDGHHSRDTDGRLLLTTIGATTPKARVTVKDALDAWFDDAKAVVPRAAVYPEGKSVRQVDRINAREMASSQQHAVRSALRHLGLSSDKVDVQLHLNDVGGPSAGLMFSLGIIDKLHGDGHGGDLTGGRTVAGTGTINKKGTVGPVGGVPLKTQAAKRDGASAFLVPRAECSDAQANLPDGLRLVPVRDLDGALHALRALRGDGGTVPSC